MQTDVAFFHNLHKDMWNWLACNPSKAPCQYMGLEFTLTFGMYGCNPACFYAAKRVEFTDSLICTQCPLVGYTQENPHCMGGRFAVWKLWHTMYRNLAKISSCNKSDVSAAQVAIADRIRSSALEIVRLPVKPGVKILAK